jgi:hypothetical protein
MLKFRPLIWIIFLAGLVVLMSNISWVDIASFVILAIGSIVAILKYGWPYCKRWKINRIYSVSFTEDFGSSAVSKSKTIVKGEQEVFVRIKAHSPQYISRARFHFNRADRRDEGGTTSTDIITFRHISASDTKCLPHLSSLVPDREHYLKGSSFAEANFQPKRLLEKSEEFEFCFTIEAKQTWQGCLFMDTVDETGKQIPKSLKIAIE